MPKIKLNCVQCGKEFERYPSVLKRGGGKFCSVGCGTTYRNIHDNPTKDPNVRKKISENHADAYWLKEYANNGYKGIEVSSYRLKAFRYYGEKCNRCGSVEKIQVHHKDRNRKNNDINNLEVLCKSCHDSEHSGEFKRLRCSKTGRFIKELK